MRRISKLDIKVLVSWLYKDSILPEFLQLFGEEITMDVLRVFGGMRIQIPSYKKVLDLKRDIDIYECLSYVNSLETVRSLAKKYDISEIWVNTLFKTMKRQYPKIVKFMETMEKGETIVVTSKRRIREEREVEESQNQDIAEPILQEHSRL